MRIYKLLLSLACIAVSTFSDAQDYLYGLTQYGGYYNKGVPYQITSQGTGFISYTDLDGNNGERPGDGAAFTQLIPNMLTGNVMVALTELGDQNLNLGNRLQITAGQGGLTPPFRFHFSIDGTGINPLGRFLTAFDGTLYGLTSINGQYGGGALFSMPPVFGNGATALIAFDGPETGSSPKGSLIQGADGKLYGMTELGGANNLGVVFSFELYAGVPLKKLLDFDGLNKGSHPTGNLFLASDGKLYGMTRTGGANGDGVIFSISMDGTGYKKLLDFDGATTGANPRGGLTEFAAGKLYGMTSSGGSRGHGTIFNITKEGTFTRIFDFDGTNGKAPRGDLLLSTSGTVLYGVAYAGGSADKGVLFKLENENVFTKLYDYKEATGSHPVGTLAMLKKPAQMIFPAISEKNTLSEPFILSVQSSADLPIYFTSNDPSVAVVENNKIRITGAGAATITAFQLGNHEYLAESATQTIIVKRVSQTITFPPIDSKTFGNPPFALIATSTSGLPVTFNVFSTDVIIPLENTAYITGGGIVTIHAMQAGNNIYEPAPQVTRDVVVNRAEQTVNFITQPIRVCCDLFPLTASSSSELEVFFKTPDRDKLRVNESYVEILKLGIAEIIAYQPGNRNFKPAEARASVEVLKGNQSIYFNPTKTSFTFGDLSPYISTGSTSGLPVIYTSNPSGIVVVEGSTLHLLGIGTTSITATQSGNELFYPATPVSVNIKVGPPATPMSGNTITWPFIPDKTMPDPPFNLAASASSGLIVTYTSSNTSVVTISGNLVNIKGTGSTTITASQPGNANIPAAIPVEKVLQVKKQSHYINFPYLSSVTFGADAVPLPLTTSVGSPIVYSSSNTDVAFVADYYLDFRSDGVATITASHPGDSEHLPVEPISNQIIVYPAYQSIDFGTLSSKTYGDGPFELVATASSGYHVVFSSSDPGIASVDGNRVTIHGAGTVTIEATQSGYPGFSRVEFPQQLVINKAGQVITFDDLTSKKFSDVPFKISASADSGIPVTFSSAKPGVAKVTGNTVTITGNGTAEIVASQTGNNNYLPAENISRKFLVDDAGNIYDLIGSVFGGGPNGSGGIYSMNSNGSAFNFLRDFAVRTIPNPQSGFIKGSDGRMYGNFQWGGLHNNGRIVKLEADASGFTVLHDYNFPTGSSPFGNLMQATNGDLYGMTRVGGVNGGGVIFKIKTDGSEYTVLYDFTPSMSGSGPLGGLVQGSNGKLFGMTPNGGFFRSGTIFSINVDGSEFNVIFHFNDGDPLKSGILPRGDLVQGADGSLFGTLAQGGVNGQGTLFKIGTDGSGFTRILNFNSAISGASPSATMLIGSGIVYGMTQAGGVNNMGTIFSVATNGTGFTRLLDFDGVNKGSNPVGKLMEASDGSLYGMSLSGGLNSKGTIFRIKKNGSGFQKLVDLDERASAPVFGPLLESTTGNFFGMTSQGGVNNGGAIIQVTSGGMFTVVKDFPQQESGPRYLISDPIGKFYYGITGYGGVSNGGVIFRINASGTAYERLMEMPNGYIVTKLFYMSTGHLWCTGSENGVNIIFRIKPDGSEFQRLVDFDNYSEEGGGAQWLVEATDGYIYGTSDRAAGQSGVVFKIKNDGTGFSKLLTFPAATEINSGGFIQASDGNFYGCTTYSTHLYRFDMSGAFTMFKYPQEGGNVPMKIIELNGGSLGIITRDGPGSIFTIEKDGTSFSKVHDDRYEDGSSPADMVQTMDGWICVAMQMGGAYKQGVVYKIRPDGSSFTKLREFNNHDGNSPTSIFFKKISQTLTFPPVSEKKTSDPAFVPEAFSTSGTPARFSSSNPNVAVVEDGRVKPIAVGKTTITASLPSNANFFEGNEVQQELIVVRGDQTIIFNKLPPVFISDGPFLLEAVSSFGLPVTFTSSNPDVASISGNTVTVHGPGTVTITASQSGNDNVFPAQNVEQELVILNGGPQTINYKNPGTKILGGPAFELEATASSNLMVQFSTISDKISINGAVVTMIRAGYVSVTARQEGDNHFDPALPVTFSFCVNPSQPTISVSAAAPGFILESSNEDGNQWYLNDLLIAGATGKNLWAGEDGTYKVITSVDGCSSTLSLPHDLITTGLTDDVTMFIDVYPNPVTSGNLQVDVGGHISNVVTLEILDAMGRRVERREMTEPGTAFFDFQTIVNGIYLMRITQNGTTVVRKLLKR